MGPSADVWSFGVVVWELGTFLAPFAGVPPVQVALGVVQNSLALDMDRLRLHTPAALSLLIPACLQRDAALRPSFDCIANDLCLL